MTFSFILDVVTIDKTGEFFRLIYDVKGRFTVHRITADEAKVSTTICISLGFIEARSSLIADESSQNRANIKYSSLRSLFGCGSFVLITDSVTFLRKTFNSAPKPTLMKSSKLIARPFYYFSTSCAK